MIYRRLNIVGFLDVSSAAPSGQTASGGKTQLLLPLAETILVGVAGFVNAMMAADTFFVLGPIQW